MKKTSLLKRMMAIVLMLAITFSDSSIVNAMSSINSGIQTQNYADEQDEVWSFAQATGYGTDDNLPLYLKDSHYKGLRDFVPRIRGNGDGTATIKWNPIANAKSYSLSIIDDTAGKYEKVCGASVSNRTYYTFPLNVTNHGPFYFQLVAKSADNKELNSTGFINIYFPGYLNKTDNLLPPAETDVTANSTSVTIKFKTVNYAKDYTVLFNNVEYQVSSRANNYGWHELTINNLKPNQTYSYAIRPNYFSKVGTYTALLPKNDYKSMPGEYGETYTLTTDHESIGSIKVTQKFATENSITVSWSGASNAKVFDLCVDGKKYSTTDRTKTVTGLTGGKTYKVYVVAKNDYKSVVSDTYDIKTPPKAPADLTVKPGEETAQISWNAVDGAEFYELKYSVDGKEQNPTTTDCNYKITGLKPNTKYTVQICCCTGDGKGSYGKAVSFTTGKAANITTAPSLSSASAEAYGARIKWTTVSGATSYELLFGNNTYTTSYDNYGVVNLTPGETYKYKIRGINDSSTGPYSQEYSITIPPNPPQDTSYTSSDTSVTLNWNKVSGATGYIVVFNGSTKEYSANATSATYTGLTSDTTYNCTIACKNAYGTGSAKSFGYVRTQKEYKNVGIPVIKDTAVTDKTATVIWNAVDGASRYELVLNGKTYTSYGLQYTVSGLSPNTNYTYKLRALNDRYTGQYTNTYTIKTTPSAPYTTATATDDSIRIEWSEQSNAAGYIVRFDGNEYETKENYMIFTGLELNTLHTYSVSTIGYSGQSQFGPEKTISTKHVESSLGIPYLESKRIHVSGVGFVAWKQIEGATGYDIDIDGKVYHTNLSYYYIEPENGYIAHFKIRAVNKKGVSAFTPDYTITVAPKGPQTVNATSTYNSITLTWSPVPGVSGYIVNEKYAVSASQTSYTITGLSADKEYSYSVGCTTEDGYDGAYDWHTRGKIRTKTLELAAPTGLTDSANETSIAISWNPVANAESYYVEVNGVKYSRTTTSFRLTGLRNGEQYTYRVAAYAAGITGPYSSLKTTYTSYAAPSYINATVYSNNTVSFNWEPNIKPTGYELWINGRTYQIPARTWSYTLNNVIGEPLTYKIRSRNGNSYSSYTAEKTVQPYPEPVTGITADVGEDFVTVYWKHSKGAGNYMVLLYGDYITLRNIETGSVSHFSGLRDSNDFRIEIYPSNSTGRNDTVYPYYVRTKLGMPFLTDSKPARVGTNYVEINWYGSFGAKSYEVIFDGKKYTTSDTYFRISGLEPGSKHTYKICSVNGNEKSRYTEEKEIETIPLPPSAPTNIAAEASATDVLISWDDNPNATGYVIYFDGKQFNAPKSPLRIKGLDSATHYYFSIRAKNSGGLGNESETYELYTKYAAPVVSKIEVEGSKAKISVNHITGVSRYIFTVNGCEYVTEDETITLGNLEPFTEYEFSVRAESDYISGESTTRTFTTGSLVPAVPTDITATRTKTSITLQWPAVTDATSYDIVFNGESYHVDDAESINNGTALLKLDSFTSVKKDKSTDILSSITFDRNAEKKYDIAPLSTIEGASANAVIANPEEPKEHDLSQKFQMLFPGTEYTYKMRANNEYGSSDYTEIMSVWTEESRDEAYNGDYNYDVTDSVRAYLDGKKNYTSADPVDSVTGAFLWSNTVVEDYGADELHFDIMYKSKVSNGVDGGTHEMGKKWSHNFNYTIRLTEKNVYFTTPYDVTIAFVKKGEIYVNMTEGDKSTFVIDSDSRRVVTTEDGTAYYFDSANRLTQITKNGKAVYDFSWDSTNKTMTVKSGREAQLQIVYSSSKVTTVKDSLGNATEFTYSNGYLSKIINPLNSEMTFSYDGEGNLSKITGFDEKVYLTNTYDDKGRVVGQELADRGETSVEYDDENRINKFTDEFGNVTSYMYDENGRIIYVSCKDKDFFNEYNSDGQLIKQTDPEGNVTETEYDSAGRICKIKYPDETFEETAYDDNGKPSFVKGRDGLCVFYEYDENGNIKKYTDKAGNSCEYLYDAFGNLITYKDFEGNIWSYEYDAYSHLSKSTDPEGNIRQFTYDRAGRITSYTSPLGGTTYYEYSASGQLLKETEDDGVTEYSYDANGNVSEVKDKKGNVEKYEYDGMGNAVKKTDRQGNDYFYEYDEAGRLINTIYPDGWIDDYYYDSYGNVSTYKDPVGYPTEYRYDKNGHLVEQKDALGGIVSYEYDKMGQMLSVTDQLEHMTSYTYDAAGRVLSITNPLGYAVSYTYDENGNIVTETDEAGNVISYEYDKENRLVKVTDSDGSETMTYDKVGNLISVKDKDGNVESYAYDADGNVVEYTDKGGNKKSYSYDSYGRLISETAANGAVIVYTYDENGNCSSVTDAESHKEIYAFNANNQISEYVDSLGNSTKYDYDTLGRIKTVTDPKGNVTKYYYDGNGNLASELNASGAYKHYDYDELNRCVGGTDEVGNKWSYTYDAAGNKTSYTDPNGNVVRFNYDANNRLTDVINAADNSIHYEYTRTDEIESITDEEGAVTSYQYDALGRVSQISDALGNSTTFTYDSNNNILSQTDANGNTYYYTYSSEGNLLSETDPEGNVTRYEYDSVGLMTSKTDANGNVTRYEYNALGQPIKIIDSLGKETEFSYTSTGFISAVKNAKGDSTHYFYDSCGNLTKTTDELGVSTCYEYDAMNNCIKEYADVDGVESCVTLYEYDAKGRRIKEITPLLETKEYEYDGNDNIIGYIDEEGRRSAIWYDLNDNPELKTYSDGTSVGYRYNKRGDLIEVTDWNGITRFDRDILGRITRVTEFDGQAVGYQYDGVGNVVSIEYPNGKTVTYGYDKNNRLSTVNDSETTITGYVYDGVGNILRFNQPGLSLSYEYNAINLPTKAILQSDDHVYGSEEYNYDELGNITSLARSSADYGIEELTSYTYDAKGQLTGIAKGEYTEKYEYDALGNRLTKLVNNNKLTTYSYNAKNQMTSREEEGHTFTYVYDKCGNLIKEETDGVAAIEYAYNNDGKLVSGINHDTAEQTTYSYNAFGMMVSNTKVLQSVEVPVPEIVDTDIETELIIHEGNILPEADASGNEAVGGEETVITDDLPNNGEISGNNPAMEDDFLPELPTIPVVPSIPDVSENIVDDPVNSSAVRILTINVPEPEMPNAETVSEGADAEEPTIPGADEPAREDISSNETEDKELLPDFDNEVISGDIIASENLENISQKPETETDDILSAVPITRSVRYVNDYLSDTNNSLYEINSDGSAVRNIYGNRYQLLAKEDEEGYLLAKTDIYMTPFIFTDINGNLVSASIKDAWGNEELVLGEMPWFTAYTYDSVIGKYYANARFYDPVNGRMLSLDPVKRNLNGYSYCDNDPVNKVDSDGEVLEWLVPGAIGLVTRGLSGVVESYISQAGNGKSFAEKTKAALAHGANEGIKGFASGATFLTSKTPLGAAVNFAAGALGEAVEEYITTGTVDYKSTLKAGVSNAAREAIYGGSCLKNVGNAMLKGGVAKAVDNALDYAFDAAEYKIKESKAEDSRPVSYDDYYNPANGCGNSDAFSVSYGSTESRGYSSGKDENPYSWGGFLKHTAKGALEGSVESGVFYGVSKLFESAKSVTACFTEGTAVLTAGGFVCIESIKEGDEVYSCNADTGEIGLKKVLKTTVHEVTELVHLTIDDETIDTTREHPFFLEGLGFIAASELRAGDEIRLYDGSTGVVKSVEIETLENPVNVYNFEVEDWHTYYVGEEGALVHNRCENILSNDANVVRGGTNSAERFTNGSGVTVDAKGRLNGVSVNSKNDLSVEILSEGIPNGKIGTTTVGQIRKLGGNVVPSPTKENPNHSTLFGITAEEAEKLFTPVIKNPALKKR